MDFTYLTDDSLLSLLLFLFLGLCFGSFASVLIYRVPRQRSWVWDELNINDVKGLSQTGFFKGLVARSFCTSCNHKLSAMDLIPVLSWVIQNRKCRYCATTIPIRYPLIELVCAALFILVYLQFGWHAKTFILCASIPFLVALFTIDIDFWILPNHLLLILLGIAIGDHAFLVHGLDSHAIINAAFFYLSAGAFYGFMGFGLRWLFFRFTGKEGLGLGDVKFFGLAGFWLGWWMTPVFLLLSSVIGIFFALYWRIFRKSNMFPYGPALVLSLLISLVYQEALISVFLF